MKFNSPVYSDVSGSVAGLTYARNKGGMYSRARTVPTNPNSAAQQAARSAFTGAVQAWRLSASQAQRDAWATYAQNVPVTNALGNSVNLSGQQMFVRANQIRIRIGAALILNGPVSFDTGVPVTAITLTDDTATPSLNLTGTFAAPLDGDSTILVQQGPMQNISKKFYKAPFRNWYNEVISDQETTFDLDLTAETPPFALADAAHNQPLRVRMLAGDGRLSEAIITNIPPTVI